MRVDSRQLQEGLEAPVFIDMDGTEHQGKLVSVIEGLALQDELNAALQAGLPVADLEQVFRKILDAMKLPADKILALPADAFWRAMDSFFTSHARKASAATTGQPTSQPTPTPAPPPPA